MSDPVKVIVHAGLPKTGTTTIEATLFANRERLAEAGIFVPIYGAKMPAHRFLASWWRDDPVESAPLREQVLAGLRAAMASAGAAGGAVVLCTETLSDPRGGAGAAVLRQVAAEGGAALHIVAYARPPIDLIPSAVQQESKGFRPRYTSIEQRLFAHVQRFATLQRSFAPEGVSLRIFDRRLLAGGDVVADFAERCAALGAPFPALAAPELKNEAISGSGCALLLHLRDALLARGTAEPARVFTAVRRVLVRFEQEAERGAKLRLPEAWKPALTAMVAAAWNELVDQAELPPGGRELVALPEALPIPDQPAFDRAAWIGGYRDSAYDAQFLAFYEAQADARLPALTELLAA